MVTKHYHRLLVLLFSGHGGKFGILLFLHSSCGKLLFLQVAPKMATAADGTHPTGMHSCFGSFFILNYIPHTRTNRISLHGIDWLPMATHHNQERHCFWLRVRNLNDRITFTTWRLIGGTSVTLHELTKFERFNLPWNRIQWRIQDFLEAGLPTPKGEGRQPIIRRNFPKHCILCHPNDRTLGLFGDVCPWI